MATSMIYAISWPLKIGLLANTSISFADRVLGTTVVGGFMFARGSGQEHWDEVKKFRKQHIQKWHELQGSAAQSKARGAMIQ